MWWKRHRCREPREGSMRPSLSAGPEAQGHPAGAPRVWVGVRLSAGWEIQEQRRFGGEARCGLGTTRKPPFPKADACRARGRRGLRSGRPGVEEVGQAESVWGQDIARRVNIRGTPRAAGDGPEGEVRGSWSRAAAPPPRPCCSEVTTGDLCAGPACAGAGSGPSGPSLRLPVSVEVPRRHDVPFPDLPSIPTSVQCYIVSLRRNLT